MKNSSIITGLLIVVLFMSLSGCTKTEPKLGNEPPKQAAENIVTQERTIMDGFNQLVQKNDVTAGEIVKFIDENVAAVSPQSASPMVMALEKNQLLNLPKTQDNFADDGAIQKTLAKGYQGELTDRFINGIPEQATKDILLATKSNGYKIETAEGMYFPVIDYSLYKKYRNNVTHDMVTYMDIMAVESDKTPVKDAALMIGWEEIVRRAVNQERFIREYSGSPKADDVKQLLKRYLSFALYGTNNTPLFSYEDKQMVPKAKKAYFEATFNVNDGNFSRIMSEYLAVVKKHDYKLTKEVDDYRKKEEKEF